LKLRSCNEGTRYAALNAVLQRDFCLKLLFNPLRDPIGSFRVAALALPIQRIASAVMHVKALQALASA
jgi:hypothetical protein